jgi:shikimate kinase
MLSVDHNLILTGYIGPEQLQIARRTAERLRMPFVDFESRLEDHAEMPGEEVRALFGETRLKTLEGELITEMVLHRGTVIHICGQTLLRSDHFARLRATGPVICIVATIDAVLQRLHLALGARFHNPHERELALGTIRREWVVRKHENIIEFDTSYLNDEQMIEGIAALWRQQAAVIDWRGI